MAGPNEPLMTDYLPMWVNNAIDNVSNTDITTNAPIYMFFVLCCLLYLRMKNKNTKNSYENRCVIFFLSGCFCLFSFYIGLTGGFTGGFTGGINEVTVFKDRFNETNEFLTDGTWWFFSDAILSFLLAYIYSDKKRKA